MRYGTEKRDHLAARSGRIQPSPPSRACSRRDSRSTARTPKARCTPTSGCCPRSCATSSPAGRLQESHERGAAQAHPPWSGASRRSTDLGLEKRRLPPDPRRGRAQPGLPLHLRRAHGALRRRLVQGHQARPRASPAHLGEGPRRHRHVPAQGREEPGLDRADRRHQLPQDRRDTARTATRGRSTSTASSTSPTAASSSSSRCSSSTWRSSTTCSARRQEHKIKPKKFAQTDIDEVIIGHTNEAEYKKLQNNEFMEALRDRTVKIDIPYITKLTKRSRSTRRTTTARRSAASTSPRTPSRWRRCGRS
jgi:hypothetical protein